MNGIETVFISTYFFDASAIVRILLRDEPGAKKVVQIFGAHAPIHTSWVLLAEALGVFKRKWQQGVLGEAQYGPAVYQLFKLIKSGKLHPVDLEVLGDGRPRLRTYDFDVIVVRRSHPELDAADALQFLAIREGVLGRLTGPSRTQLVTADSNLRRAAEAEGIPVVDVSAD